MHVRLRKKSAGNIRDVMHAVPCIYESNCSTLSQVYTRRHGN